jgi:serine phosphatase RsbU (regulator of sigma subunit)
MLSINGRIHLQFIHWLGVVFFVGLGQWLGCNDAYARMPKSYQLQNVDSMKRLLKSQQDTALIRTYYHLVIRAIYLDRNLDAAQSISRQCLLEAQNQYLREYTIPLAQFVRAEWAAQASVDTFMQVGQLALNELARFPNLWLWEKGRIHMQFCLFYNHPTIQPNRKKAVEHGYKAIQLYTLVGDLESIQTAEYQLGYAQVMMGHYKMALESFRSSYQHAIQLKRKPKDLAGLANAIGGAFQSLQENDSALKYFKIALAIYDKENSYHGILMVHHNMATIYLQKNDLSFAAFHQEKAYYIYIHHRINQDETNLLLQLAKIYRLQGKLALAARRIEEAEKKVRAINNKEGLQMILAEKAAILERLGRYAEAYTALFGHAQLKDSLNTADRKNELDKILAENETEKKEVENQMLRQANALQQAKNKQQKTLLIASGLGAFLLLVLAVVFQRGNKAKKKANKLLRRQNDEMRRLNSTIQEQNVELNHAYHELNATLDEVQAQKTLVEHKNHHIESSIRYAYQIQTAILPTASSFLKGTESGCVFYQPKDIVSGDFYWSEEVDGLYFYCLADCTGHGVPGAFMSVLGANALHRAVLEMGLIEPDQIFGVVDAAIRRALRQDEGGVALDGMDAALLIFIPEKRQLQFCGAGRNLLQQRSDELLEIKGTRFSLGGRHYRQKTFHTTTIDLQPGDRYFLFTDGITDQFGGELGRKLGHNQLHDWLLSHSNTPINEIGQLVKQLMHQWMNGYDQLDDQTFIAIAF